MEKPHWIAFMSIFARAWRRSPVAPEGLATSGDTLGEIARLAPDEALHRVAGTAQSLNAGQVKARLRAVGPNQVAQAVRHTIIGELVSRSINPLNLLLLTLAAASYFTGDQRTQTLIIHILRTAKVPFFESRASAPVIVTSLIIAAVGVALPFSPLGSALGFVRLPPSYYIYLCLILLSYAVMTHLVKTWGARRFGLS